MYATPPHLKLVNYVEYMKAGESALVQAGNPRS